MLIWCAGCAGEIERPPLARAVPAPPAACAPIAETELVAGVDLAVYAATSTEERRAANARLVGCRAAWNAYRARMGQGVTR